ncbi:MAG: CYTH domain-containing protein [Eubacteriales bacterium]|nr:CYTH domain-containing protein [Eubacteriales bacterium]
MKSYEIERKYLIRSLPFALEEYPHRDLEQGYLSTDPVVRIRREDDDYYLTYKGRGMMVREEYNLPLTASSYEHLKTKIDGRLISKRRYLIPLEDRTVELDVFSSPRPGLLLAEVEFASEEEALSFAAPDWFGEEVTSCPEYHNSALSKL